MSELPSNAECALLISLESRTGGLTPCVPAGGIAGLLNNIPEFTLPELPDNMRPSSGMRAASFDVIFLDEVRRSPQKSISYI